MPAIDPLSEPAEVVRIDKGITAVRHPKPAGARCADVRLVGDARRGGDQINPQGGPASAIVVKASQSERTACAKGVAVAAVLITVAVPESVGSVPDCDRPPAVFKRI